MVHTIPVLVKLRARYPRARIDWLITPENAEVVRHHPALSNVVLFARREFSKPGQRWRATLGFFDLLKQIRRAKYDLVVDMHGQVRSALFALVSGARVRIGFDRPIEFSRTISAEHDLKNVPNRGWRGAREGSWIAYTTAFPFRRSMFTRLIVTCGSDRCLVSMMNRRTWQSISHRKQSTTSTDCSMSTVCLRANHLLFLCPGRFGKQSTGPSKDLQASLASFFAKDLRSLSRVRNAMRRAASKSQPPRRGRSIFAVKLLQQIWRG